MPGWHFRTDLDRGEAVAGVRGRRYPRKRGEKRGGCVQPVDMCAFQYLEA